MASVLEQKGKGGLSPGVRNAVPIVDHQRDAIVVLVYLVDQRRQDVAPRIVAMLLEHLPQRGGQLGTNPPDRLQQVGEEPHRVVVVVVDRQPAHRDAVAHEFLAPLRGQRALAESGRRVNEYQPSPAARAERLDQTVAG